MTAYEIAAVALFVLGLGPASVLGCRGPALERLVGLQLVGLIAVLLLMLLAQVSGQSSVLILPVVLAALTVTGTLVFTRLIAPRRGSERGR